MEEIWKDIIIEKNGVIYDYTGYYQISNMGRVRSLNYLRSKKTKILKPRNNGNDYLKIYLCKDKEHETFYIHRLVANAFVENDNPLEKTQINHKDEDRKNNIYTNLEWCTQKYNCNYGNHNKKMLSSRIKNGQTTKVICLNDYKIFDTVHEALRYYGICANIHRCCRGEAEYAGIHPITGDELFWVFEDDFKKGNYIQQYPKKVIGTNKKTGEIKIFNNASEAGKWLGKDSNNISKCCRGGLKTAHGYYWQHVEIFRTSNLLEISYLENRGFHYIEYKSLEFGEELTYILDERLKEILEEYYEIC